MESILIIFVTLSTLILFQTFSIAHILLIAICNFFLSSALIAYNGHIFIASIFLIVYTGAILVMICVAYLLTPSIQKKKIKKNIVKKQSDTINIVFFNLFIILLISTFILIQLNDNTEPMIDLARSNYFSFSKEPVRKYIDIETFRNSLKFKFLTSPEYLFFDLMPDSIREICGLGLSNQTKIKNSSFIDTKSIIDLDNIILKTFQTINKINYTNTVSHIYTKHPLSFLAIGIYLLITLLICLRMFIIMAKSIIIKRQDIIDQILKIWKKS